MTQTIHDSLQQQVQLCQGFLCLLKEEQNALVSMDLQSLMHFSRKKEELLLHIQRLDSSIQDSTGRLAVSVNAMPGSLAELIPLLDDDAAEELDDVRQKLKQIREEILVRNLINKRFTEDTLMYLNDAIALISGGGVPPSTYADQARHSRKNSDPSLISREV